MLNTVCQHSLDFDAYGISNALNNIHEDCRDFASDS